MLTNRRHRRFEPATWTAAATAIGLNLLLAACGTRSPAELPQPPPVFPSSTCFWAGPYVQQNDATNFALLDTGAVYWTSRSVLPEGARLRIHGEFAHGRYQSLNVYNAEGAATDALNDAQTQANPGATNPFLPDADRNAAERGYGIVLVPEAPPADATQRAPNTLYASRASDGRLDLIYRLYVPDAAAGLTGGVALPAVDLELADGTVQSGEAACASLQAENQIMPQSTTVPPAWQYALVRNQPLRAEGFPAENPAVWYKFFNSDALIACAFLKLCGGQPEASGGVYNNIDNHYVYSFVSRAFGPVVVLRGRLPVTPRTVDGDSPFQAGELRYWSICSYEMYTQRVQPQGCLYDQQLPLDSGRHYTIVSSAPADRPANAREDCGYAWLEWSPQGDGYGNTEDGNLLLRNMLAAADFAHSVQQVTQPGDEAAVMGEYLPTITYSDRAAFESLGCTGAAR